jgi:hypothetical protein
MMMKEMLQKTKLKNWEKVTWNLMISPKNIMKFLMMRFVCVVSIQIIFNNAGKSNSIQSNLSFLFESVWW